MAEKTHEFTLILSGRSDLTDGVIRREQLAAGLRQFELAAHHDGLPLDGEDDGPVIEARVIRERVEFVQPPRRTGWSSPTVTKIVRWYVAIVITIVKVLIAVPLTIMLLGSLWLLWTIVTLPKP